MLADRIDQLGPGQTARVDGLLNVLDFLHGELASGQNLWRSVSDQHAAAPKRPPYHLKTVFACPLLFCDKKFLQVGLSCSNFTGSRTMRQSWPVLLKPKQKDERNFFDYGEHLSRHEQCGK